MSALPPLSPDTAARLLGLVDERLFVLAVAADGSVALEWAHPSVADLTGYPREELQALGGWPAILHEADRAHVLDEVGRAVAGEPVEYEYRYRTRAGEIVWARNRLQPVRDEAGRVVRLCGTAQDLTRHAETQELARTRERQLRDLLDALPIGVWFVDRRGIVQMVNAVGRRMCDEARAGGHADRTRSIADDAVLRQVLETGEPAADRELTVELPDGSLRVLLGSFVPVRDSAGGVSGAICLFSDVTERKRMEAQLLQGQRMESIGRMAGGIAHDFNNLLTIIIGCAEMTLQFDHAGPSKAEWEETLAAARRASQLTSQLLAFARQQPVVPRMVDFNLIVTRVEGLLRRVIGEDVRLEVRTHGEPLPVNIDPGQFEQILLNLAVNARDAMPGGGTLRVTTGIEQVTPAEAHRHPGLEPGEKVKLTVSDTGVGIPDDVRSRIFEPFFTTKGPGRGTGLGLAMCYGIVKQAGGYIGVHSDVGKGATFWVYLPVAHGEIPAEEPVHPAVTTQSHARILLVEDERAVADFTRRALELGGYAVRVAHSGAEALEMLDAADEPVDLLLADVVMPDMRGTALARRVLQQDPGMRVLFVSGYPGPLEPDFSTAQLLQKPFTPSELLQYVGEALRN
ncbi:MAG: PAS domain S-box protein [Acidimicrobiia bacterium]|nr:PAS domain S-box protein [Acidimicrobiia bacterium]